MSLPDLASWFSQELASLNLQLMLVLFLLALVISAIGFYRVVCFISIGYAFSIVAMAAAVMILLRRPPINHSRQAGRKRKPGKKVASNAAAPAANITLIRTRGVPNFLGWFTHLSLLAA